MSFEQNARHISRPKPKWLLALTPMSARWSRCRTSRRPTRDSEVTQAGSTPVWPWPAPRTMAASTYAIAQAMRSDVASLGIRREEPRPRKERGRRRPRPASRSRTCSCRWKERRLRPPTPPPTTTAAPRLNEDFVDPALVDRSSPNAAHQPGVNLIRTDRPASSPWERRRFVEDLGQRRKPVAGRLDRHDRGFRPGERRSRPPDDARHGQDVADQRNRAGDHGFGSISSASTPRWNSWQQVVGCAPGRYRQPRRCGPVGQIGAFAVPAGQAAARPPGAVDRQRRAADGPEHLFR